MKLYKKNRISYLISAIIILSGFKFSNAENPLITINDGSISNGTAYWQSSNIREWLNSSENRVNYTGNIPSKENNGVYAYDKEPGFLTSFTKEELEAIATTKRKVFVTSGQSQHPDGGNKYPKLNYNSYATNNSFGDLISNWNNYYYQIVLDKVFYLNTAEYFYYLESRGFEEPKTLREDIAIKYNYTSKYVDWFLTHSSLGGKYSDNSWKVYSANNNNIQLSSPGVAGVVPALHIKPDYIFSNGRIASEISIGEEVTFGAYKDKDIIWKAINKTNEGYLLLLSKEAIDLKHFNSKGNATIYKYSNYINFEDYDIDISKDLQVGALRNNDIELPSITVKNENILFERQSNAFNLEFTVYDNVGIDYILLPNGNKIRNTETFNYAISSNRDYFFEIKDVSGNVRQYVYPIYNINIPTKVEIISSSNGWTNQNVIVNINSSDINVGSYTKETITSKRDTFLNEWANYNSYKGRPIRITGSVELVSHDLDLGDVSTGLGLYYNNISKTTSGDFILSKAIKYPQRWRLDYLKENGKQDFDIVTTIPNDVNNYFHPFFQIESYETNAYSLKWSNVTFELLDKEDFGIEKIILPNGTEIKESSYTGILTEEGTYLYTVYDSNGVITEKEIRVLIDKTPPEIEFIYDNSIPMGINSKLKVVTKDSQSKVNKILLPNGEIFYGDTIDYNLSLNGVFTFKAYDNAGNIASKSITITNIDDEVTDVYITKNPSNSISKTVELSITVNDPSGVTYIELPDKNRVSVPTATYIATENGEYLFVVYDGAGNKDYFYAYIDNIDNDNPSISINKDNYDWTNKGVQININTMD